MSILTCLRILIIYRSHWASFRTSLLNQNIIFLFFWTSNTWIIRDKWFIDWTFNNLSFRVLTLYKLLVLSPIFSSWQDHIFPKIIRNVYIGDAWCWGCVIMCVLGALLALVGGLVEWWGLLWTVNCSCAYEVLLGDFEFRGWNVLFFLFLNCCCVLWSILNTHLFQLRIHHTYLSITSINTWSKLQIKILFILASHTFHNIFIIDSNIRLFLRTIHNQLFPIFILCLIIYVLYLIFLSLDNISSIGIE